jgi:hypothetical protein
MAFVGRLRALPFGFRIAAVLGAAALAAAALLLLPAIPQPESFHDFVDKRGLAGIPNFGDVASNLAFLAAGISGLLVLRNLPAGLPQPGPAGRLPYGTMAAGLMLVCLGSGYYHWAPDTPALFWDRLSMTVAFMALAAAIVGERIDARAGLLLLPVLLALGAAAAIHWRQSELAGAGDLRVYFMVQAVPAVALPAIVLLFAGRAGGDGWLVLMLACYALAMGFEQFDRQVLAATGGAVSGHTLKHLLAGLGGYLPFHRLSRATGAPTSP